MHRRYI